jgi:hypothetical protein
MEIRSAHAHRTAGTEGTGWKREPASTNESNSTGTTPRWSGARTWRSPWPSESCSRPSPGGGHRRTSRRPRPERTPAGDQPAAESQPRVALRPTEPRDEPAPARPIRPREPAKRPRGRSVRGSLAMSSRVRSVRRSASPRQPEPRRWSELASGVDHRRCGCGDHPGAAPVLPAVGRPVLAAPTFQETEGPAVECTPSPKCGPADPADRPYRGRQHAG